MAPELDYDVDLTQDPGVLNGPVQVTVADRTYQIVGTADGFDTDSPSFRKPGKFSIQVAC